MRRGGVDSCVVASTWTPPPMFPGPADGLAPMKERPTGVPEDRGPWPHTWFGHAEARAALAQWCAQPAAFLPLQRAVPARFAAADPVLLPSAGLSLHLVYKSRKGSPGSAPPPPAPPATVLQHLRDSASKHTCSPRLGFLSSKMGPVLPLLPLACLPHGAIGEHVMRQDENAIGRAPGWLGQ